MTFYSDLFQKKDSEKLTIAADIAVHANWISENIFQQPYEQEGYKDIPRKFHGAQHACRVALYIPIFINLWSKYHDTNEQLTDIDIKYLQIAALFHDSGREGDDRDNEIWEKDSAKKLLLLFNSMLRCR